MDNNTGIEDALQVIKTEQDPKSKKTLILRQVNFQTYEMRMITEALVNYPNIASIKFLHCIFNLATCAMLAEALPRSSIQLIIFAKCDLQDTTCKINIMRAISIMPELRKIEIIGCNFSERCIPMSVNLIRQNRKIVSINLARESLLGSPDFIQVADALHDLDNTVKTLCFRCSYINDNVLSRIFEALSLGKLKALEFIHCGLSNEQILHLSQVLPFSSLYYLTIKDNNLSETSVANLKETFDSFPDIPLQSVNFSRTYLTDDTFLRLFQGISSLRHIQKVNVEGNTQISCSYDDLAPVIKHHATLNHLGINKTSISQEDQDKIKELCAVKKSKLYRLAMIMGAARMPIAGVKSTFKMIPNELVKRIIQSLDGFHESN